MKTEIQDFINGIGSLNKFTREEIAKFFLPFQFAQQSSALSVMAHPKFGTVKLYDWPSGWRKISMEIPKQIRISMPEVESIIENFPTGGYRVLHEDMVEAWYTRGVEYFFRVQSGELILTFLDDEETLCEKDHQHERIKSEVLSGTARLNCRLVYVSIHNEPSEDTKNGRENLAAFRVRNLKDKI